MTQQASISSLNKKSFLKKALKGFCTQKECTSRKNPPLPIPQSREEVDGK
ncbi:hypothetical protein [Maridesulfovibrio sp. FT414]